METQKQSTNNKTCVICGELLGTLDSQQNNIILSDIIEEALKHLPDEYDMWQKRKSEYGKWIESRKYFKKNT